VNKVSRKRFTVADGYDVRELIQAGVDHIASAKVLFKRDFRCFDSAGYLVHLGLELLLKSLLLHLSGEFREGHSLVSLKSQLIALLPSIDSVLPDDLVATFDEFNELRYPRPNGLPEIGTSDWIAFEEAFLEFLAAMPSNWYAELEAIEGTKKAGRILMVKDMSEGQSQ
jgi:HEPN domain-containing protein